VVLKNPAYDVGAGNKRHLCALYCAHSAGFEIIQGLLDRLMISLGAVWKHDGLQTVPGTNYYYIKSSDDPAFFEGRRADVYFNDQKVGVLGIVHPVVLSNYHIPFPCSAIELNIEPFVNVKTTKH